MAENDLELRGTSTIGTKSEGGLGSQVQESLDFMIQYLKGEPAEYKTTFFENRVVGALSSTKFGNNSLYLPKRYGNNLVRLSPEDLCGITCRYIRTPGKNAIRNKDMNDHEKVIEVVEFNMGVFRTRLQRGDYSISLSYGSYESKAVPAIVDAFREFKRRCDETGNAVGWEQFRTESSPLVGTVSASFDDNGDDEDRFPLRFELFFQYEILQNFLAGIGMLKVRKPSRSP